MPSTYMNRLSLPLPFFSFHAETVDVQAMFVHPGPPIGSSVSGQ
jgi:hypothetical protein